MRARHAQERGHFEVREAGVARSRATFVRLRAANPVRAVAGSAPLGRPLNPAQVRWRRAQFRHPVDRSNPAGVSQTDPFGSRLQSEDGRCIAAGQVRMMIARLIFVGVLAGHRISVRLCGLPDDRLSSRRSIGSNARHLSLHPRTGGDAWPAQRHDGC